MKSAPGPSTIELGAKPSVIEPPLPSVTTSSESLTAPAPLGGPSTTCGKSAWPKSGPGPAVNDSTELAKREAQLCSTPAAALSELAEPHAEEKNPTERSAPSARPRKLTNLDSRASSRSVVDGAEAILGRFGAPTDWSSDFPLIRAPPSRASGNPTLTGLFGGGYSGYGGGSVPDLHRTSQGGLSTSPRGAQ